MKKVGEILRKNREDKGLSLHEVGISLKINPKILKAIEDGETKNLPAKAFLKGFVKSYAQFLKIDVNEVLKVLQEELGEPIKAITVAAQEPSQATEPTTAKPEVDKKPIQSAPSAPAIEKPSEKKAKTLPLSNSDAVSKKKLTTIAASVALILLIGFVVKMLEKYEKEAETPTSVGAAETATSEITTTTLVDSLTSTTVALNMEKNPVSAPMSAISPAASQALLPTTTIPSQSTTTTTTVAETTTTTLAKVKTFEIIVEALNKVSVSYSLNGEGVKTLDLAKGQIHTFKSKNSASIELSDGGAANIIVNGRDKGVPGTIGKPYKLSFP